MLEQGKLLCAFRAATSIAITVIQTLQLLEPVIMSRWKGAATLKKSSNLGLFDVVGQDFSVEHLPVVGIQA
jgi:hypothetical protein